MSAPKKHHYIPSFYLNKWCGSDNLICQYSKFNEQVKALRRHPNATGFEPRLYSIEDLDDEIAHVVEDRFFKLVDTRAADALRMLERAPDQRQWSPQLRSAWSRFLYSLLLRCPEDIREIRRGYRLALREDRDGSWQDRYNECRGPEDPEDFRDFLAQRPNSEISTETMQLLMKLTDSTKIGNFINNLHWHVIELNESKFSLLTSDRPVVRSNGLDVRGGHIGLPIGPRKMFLAVRDEHVLETIKGWTQTTLVRTVNQIIVEKSEKYVYGMDDSQLRFVENRFGRSPEKRFLKNLADSTELRVFG